MAKQLTTDEMLECLLALKHPAAPAFQGIIEATGNAMAQFLAKELNVHAGPATFQGTAFAETCAPFTPAFPGQPCPPPLSEYDCDEWTD
jgi:hypothetical protein